TPTSLPQLSLGGGAGGALEVANQLRLETQPLLEARQFMTQLQVPGGLSGILGLSTAARDAREFREAMEAASKVLFSRGSLKDAEAYVAALGNLDNLAK